ncbi:MAG: hypothetical protein H6728_03000 [Myxococcales bacterium]|nr:hypothetical protein [Myxococcales bacterium]MCB9642021.1 hypothetical protein [Myxococcales bacterium]
MQDLLHTDHVTIQSRFRILPRLTTRFNIVDDSEQTIGTLISHPAWSFPVLWFVGFLLEIGMIAGGIYLAINQKGNGLYIGAGIAFLGVLMLLLFRFHSFLATRAPTSIELRDRNNDLVLTSRKGWALFQPLFTLTDGQGNTLGQSRQSFLWGDRKYLLWDDKGQRWGSINRRLIGSKYDAYRGNKAVARFRKKLIDARKLLGLRSYLLEFQDSSLTPQERAVILGTIANTDVLMRQKKLRDDKENIPTPVPTKN